MSIYEDERPEPLFLPKYSSPGWRGTPEVTSVAQAIDVVATIIGEMAPFPETVEAHADELFEGRLKERAEDVTLTEAQVAKMASVMNGIWGRLTDLQAWPRMPELIIVSSTGAACRLWDREHKRVYQVREQ